MQTIEYRTVDKSAWGDGPWQSEPDKRQWEHLPTRLPCLIVRGPAGSLCGYVGVPRGHPAFGIDYDHVDVEVHGGLNFAGPCSDEGEDHAICHKPGPGDPDDVWWLGFDTAHAFDLSPAAYGALRAMSPRLREHATYRDLAYVQAEVEKLAEQLAAKQV